MFPSDSLFPVAYFAVLAAVFLYLHSRHRRIELLLWGSGWGILLLRGLVVEAGPGSGWSWTAVVLTAVGSVAFFLGAIAFARVGRMTSGRAALLGVASGALAAVLVVGLRVLVPEAGPERMSLGLLAAAWIATGWIVDRTGRDRAPVGARFGGLTLLAWGVSLLVAVAISPVAPDPGWMIVGGTVLGGLVAVGMLVLAFESAQGMVAAGRVDPRRLLDDDPNMIVVIQDETIVFANRAVEERLGYGEREMARRGVFEHVAPEDRDRAREVFRARLEGRRIEDYELEILDSDGERIHVLVHADSILWQGRPALKYELTDVSTTKRAEEEIREMNRELKRINAELEQANRLQSEFLSNTTHELKTPLTSIIANTEILEYEMCGPVNEEQTRILASISHNSQQLLEMISQLLDFARKREGYDAPQYEDVAVRAVLDGVVETVRPMLEEKGLAIETEVVPGAEHAWLDASKVYRVYLNLTENAIKFSSDGVICLRAERVEGEFQGSVADEGIGIPDEKREEIFQSFRQVDASVTRSYGGVGLGLAICRQLVELHGGRIWVDSEPGKGSVFAFRLPGRRPIEPATAEGETAPDTASE